MKIALAVQSKTPAGVLSQSMKHMVEEPNACVDSNLLRLASLGSMVITVVEKTRVSVWGEIAAVEVKSELDLCLVCVASESGPSGSLRRGHFEDQLVTVQELSDKVEYEFLRVESRMTSSCIGECQIDGF